jgi:VWFA-related protein
VTHLRSLSSRLGFLFLVSASAARGQTPQGTAATSPPSAIQSPSRPIPLYRATANLVLVDVVVRDKGNPVHGLAASDFHILEDGREQKITVFEEHRSTDVLEVANAPANLPSNTYSDAPRYAIASAANVLLLDALNTPLSDQIYVRRRMIQYLHTIPPGTRIAVFTMASHLRIVEGFTTDSSVIEKALQSGRGNAEPSPVMDADFDQALTDVNDLAAGGGASALAQEAMQQFANDTKSFESQLRSEMTIDALDQMARYLSTVPGRKNLIWFTGSMPFNPNTGSRPDQDQMVDLRDQAKNMLELLAVARVALYPVDSRGLMSPPSNQAQTNILNPNLMNSVTTQSSGLTRGGSLSKEAQQIGPATSSRLNQRLQQGDEAFLDQIAFDHLNMDVFAKETGGKAFFNTNGLGAALGDAISNGSDYYTLAYAPQNRNYNGSYRKVEVRLTEGHYDLEYRRGYFSVDPATQNKLVPGRRSPLIDAMQHGVLPLSQVPFQVRVVPATDPVVKDLKFSADPAGLLAKSLRLPLERYVSDFTIDPDGLDSRELPDGRRHTEIELTQVAYDLEGIRQNYTDAGLGIDTPPSQKQDGIHLHQEIDLPAGKFYLRIGVHDLISGRIGTVEIPLKVAKP